MATAASAHKGALARAVLERAEAETGTQVADLTDRTLAVADAFRPLLPHGLRRGSVVELPQSTSLAFAVLARASAAGSWVALVGLPDAGWVAAAELGIDLERVAVVPNPGPDLPAVLATLIDGVDIVVVGPRAAAVLGLADRRRIEARLRDRGSVMVSLGQWPGAAARIVPAELRWTGLGCGYGRLRRSVASVRSEGRGSFGRNRSLSLEVQGDCSLGERLRVPVTDVDEAPLAPVYELVAS